MNKTERQKEKKEEKEQEIKNAMKNEQKEKIGKLTKEYQIEKSAAQVNMENNYLKILEKEKQKIKQQYENQLGILTLKIKQLKSQAKQNEQQLIIYQEQIKREIESEHSLQMEAVERTKKLNEYKKKLEQKNEV